MDEIIVTAKTYDEAVTNALLQLGTSSEHVKIETLETGTEGIFGFRARPYRIKVTLIKDEESFDYKKDEADENIKSPVRKEEFNKKRNSFIKKFGSSDENKFGNDCKSSNEKKHGSSSIKSSAFSKVSEETGLSDTKKFSNIKSDIKSDIKAENLKEKISQNTDTSNDRGSVFDVYAGNDVSKVSEAEKISVNKDSDETNNTFDVSEKEIYKFSEEEIENIKNKAKEFLTAVIEKMHINADMDISFNEGELSVIFSGRDMGIMIGKKGETLDSLQYLTSLTVNKNHAKYVRVKLDAENYREKRKDMLEKLAKSTAFKVAKTKHSMALDPMNPYERRIVHSALQNDPYVTTVSEGEEPYRHIIVMLKRNKKYSR